MKEMMGIQQAMEIKIEFKIINDDEIYNVCIQYLELDESGSHKINSSFRIISEILHKLNVTKSCESKE